jgi:hypothetical protein
MPLVSVGPATSLTITVEIAISRARAARLKSPFWLIIRRHGFNLSSSQAQAQAANSALGMEQRLRFVFPCTVWKVLSAKNCQN